MSGEYIIQEHEGHSDAAWPPDDMPTKHGSYLQGNYLRCVAEVSNKTNKIIMFQAYFSKCLVVESLCRDPQDIFLTIGNRCGRC